MNISLDTSEMESSEKRRYRRILLRQPVQFQSQHSALEGGSLSFDLSAGGMCVDMYDFLPLDAEVTLHVRLAIEKVVEYVGRVVWVRKYPFADRYRVGLEFSGDNLNKRSSGTYGG